MTQTASSHTLSLAEIAPAVAALLTAIRECEANPRLTRDDLKALGLAGPLNGQHLGEGFHRIDSYSDAEVIAMEMTTRSGRLFIAEDRGDHTRPRYAVVQAPRVGDKASYGFNGDSYECGYITKISGQNMRRIETTEEGRPTRVFWRRKLSSSWKYDQTWSLMVGHHNERNPEF